MEVISVLIALGGIALAWWLSPSDIGGFDGSLPRWKGRDE